MENFQDALEITDLNLNPRDHFGIRGEMLLVKRRLGQHWDALREVDVLITQSGGLGQLSIKANLLNTKAVLLYDINEKSEARLFFEESLNLSKQIGYEMGIHLGAKNMAEKYPS